MPYRDKYGRLCGFLDFEEKEGTGHYVRRYFLLDQEKEILEYYLDNPLNLPIGAEAIGAFKIKYVSMVEDISNTKAKDVHYFCLTVAGKAYNFQANDAADKTEWIKELRNATRIVVPNKDASAAESDENLDPVREGCYKAQVIGGVVLRMPLDTRVSAASDHAGSIDSDFDSSCEELSANAKDAGAHYHVRPVRMGYCIKQGGMRKNWKKRFFVLDAEGLSYYKTPEEKLPIRTIKLSDILDVRMSIGIHLNRENVFEVVTSNRVFYVQAQNATDRDQWIAQIHQSREASKRPTRQEVGTPSMVVSSSRELKIGESSTKSEENSDESVLNLSVPARNFPSFV